MIYDNKGYVLEYWMTNNPADCGRILKNDDLNINLTDRELEIMNRMDLSTDMLLELYAEEDNRLKQIENENKPKHNHNHKNRNRNNNRKNKIIKKI